MLSPPIQARYGRSTRRAGWRHASTRRSGRSSAQSGWGTSPARASPRTRLRSAAAPCGSLTTPPRSYGSRGGGASVSRIDVGNDPTESRSATGRRGSPTTRTAPCRGSTPPAASQPVITVGPGASGIAVGAGAVWVANTLADTLVRIDPSTNSVTTTIPVGSRPRGVALRGRVGMGGQQRRRHRLARGPANATASSPRSRSARAPRPWS